MIQQIRRSAELDGPYRYLLTRAWGPVGCRLLPVVMLNPSTADALTDDATVRWLMSYARLQGFGGIMIGNLYAFRSKDPKLLGQHDDPVGPLNNMWLRTVIAAARGGGWLLVGWGDGARKLTSYEQRVRWLLEATAERAVDLRALGVTKSGAPWHPLRHRLNTAAVVWRPT